MDPLTALILALWIAAKFTKNVYQDSVYKATGKLPPSYLREVERRERRGQVDGPGRRFWRNAWDDACAEADARRARRFAKRRERLKDRWGHEDTIDEAERQAWEDNRARDRAEDEAREQNTPTERCQNCGAQVPTADVRIRALGDYNWRLCPICADHVDQVADAKAHDWRCSRCGLQVMSEAAQAACWMCRLKDEHAATEPTGPQQPSAGTPPEQDAPAADTPEPAEPHQQDDADDHPGAEVIYPSAWQETDPIKQEDTDSMETNSLNAGLAYTQNMAVSAQQGVSSVETSIASMTAGGVTGPTITALQAAQEALSNAAAQFHAAHAALQRHIQVQEAYAANTDAGNREFVRAD